MTLFQQAPVNSAQLADEALRQVLKTQWQREIAIIVQSPPGGGKTGVVERMAIQEMALLRGRAMVATQTNEQAFDFARRLASHYKNYSFHLLVRQNLSLPDDLTTLSNLVVIQQSAQIPTGPCVVIANAAKWSWTDETLYTRFTCQIIDEAYQLADYRFQQISGLADRLVLVGDPGQIAPVITCPVERWQSDAAGPHIACPKALLVRHPSIKQIPLPVSRRLVADTVDLIQPAFYPLLPFVALSQHGARKLTSAVKGLSSLDRVVDCSERGASVVQVELPGMTIGDVDEQLAEVIVKLIVTLLRRDCYVQDDGGAQLPLKPSMIGVVCAHVAQVSAVLERLPEGLDVLVETADRFQGLERPIMIVHHPLSGRTDADTFHTDAGRLCVMLSRHRIACFVVTREGVENVLQRNPPPGNRILGVAEDSEYIGWKAHLRVLQWLRTNRRAMRL
jgi:hypothetical protein